MHRFSILRRLALTACSLFALMTLVSACSQDAHEGAQDDAAAVGTTTKYDWYLQGKTPAGNSTLVRSGDGRVTNKSFVHWNNREYTINSELQLDSEGMVVAQRITGISPFKAPIDETFSYVDGVATWSTVGDSGSAEITEPAFYINNEMGAFESVPALIKAASRRIDGEVPLLPSGSARIEHVRDMEVATDSGVATASLYSVSGIGMTPIYLWLDSEQEMLALDFNGYLGMVPEGWGAEALAELSAAQTEASAAHTEAMAGDLATNMSGPLLFENVDVLDVEAGDLLQGYFVLVEDGKIAAISNLPLDVDDAIRIDATGKTLMPGLWDMHGHFGLDDGILNIAGGITNVRIIGGVHDKIMEMTEKVDAGTVIGPHTYRAGFIDKSGPYASGWNAETLEEILERVDFFAEHGYIQIKLYSSIEPEWVAPIAERAHSHGMRLSGHIPAFMSAEQAIRAGYDEIQHINMVFLNFIAGDQADTRQQLRFSLYGEKAANIDLDGEEVAAFMALLKANDVVIDPTAAIFESMLTHVAGEPDPTFAAVIEHLPPTVSRGMFSPQFPHGEAWARSLPNQSAMLRKLYENGIQLVPGSDNMAAFTIHRELETYAEAGIPNAAVLKMATLDSARVTGVEDRTGSIEVGKDSDLILLDGNPLEDISAVRRATLVMKGNTIYRPDELYKAIGVKPFIASNEI
jgi:imidazolonepropionase-like amidohydrolase